MKNNLTKIFILFSFVLGSFGANAQCDNALYQTLAMVDCPDPVVIANCTWAGDHNLIGNIVAGNDYEFGIEDPTYFITLRDATDNTVLATGTGSVMYTAATANDIEMHVNTSAACGGATVCQDVTLTCVGCMPVAAPPANDVCTSAEPVVFDVMGMATLTGTTTDACHSAVPMCGTALSTAGGVWYSFTASGTGDITINTCTNTAFDTKLGVFSGTCAALVCEAGNDDACGVQSSVTITVTEGEDYFVLVTGFGANTGDFELSLVADPCITAPPLMLSVDPLAATVCPNEEVDIVATLTDGVPISLTTFYGMNLGFAATNGFWKLVPETMTASYLMPNLATPGQVFAGYAPDGISYTLMVGADSGGLTYDTYNTETGVLVNGPAVTGGLAGGFPISLFEDPTDGTIYYADISNFASAAAAVNIYVFDQGAATLTLMSTIPTPVNSGTIWVVASVTGKFIGLDIVNDDIVEFDLNTNTQSLLNANPGIAGNPNFAQGAFYNQNVDEIYAMVYTGGGTGGIYEIDENTGVATLIMDTGFNGGEFTVGGAAAVDPSGFNIAWTPNDGNLSCTDCATPTFTAPGAVGTYTYTVTASDACGTIVTETVTFTVAYDIAALACNDHINFSVDDVCGGEIAPDMILEGALACSEAAYFVVIKDEQGNVIGNPPVGGWGNYVNTDLTAEIVDPLGTIACWGTVRIEDNIEPVVVGCGGPPQPINCYDVDRYLTSTTLGRPSAANVVDNCVSNLSWELDDISSVEFGTNDCQTRIWRVWVATYNKKDGTTGSVSCTKVYDSQPLSLSQITYPAPLVELTCGASTNPEDLPIGSQYPKVGGVDLKPGNSICNLFATYDDIELNACGVGCHGNKKIIRTWTILDWCSGAVLPTVVQIIKAVDTEGPTFFLKDTVVSTRPWDCTATFEPPVPWELHDNCDPNPTYTITGPAGVDVRQDPITGVWTVSGAPKGPVPLTYTASDCCGKTTSHTAIVTVRDGVAPIVSTIRDVVVSLVPTGFDGVGQAKLFWYHIDNNSYDACTDVKVEIRRAEGAPDCGNIGVGTYNNNETFNNDGHSFDDNKDTDGGEFVKFCCEDLSSITVDANGDGVLDSLDLGFVEVIIRVWDNADMTFDLQGNPTYGTAGDNYNEAWSFVKVEDNAPANITCPVDATIYCDWAIDDNFVSPVQTRASVPGKFTSAISVDGVDFHKTGVAEAYSTCGLETVDFIDVVIIREFDALNQCGIGRFTRVFRVTKPGKNGGSSVRYCWQKITVLGRDNLLFINQDANGNGFIQDDLGPFPVSCSGPTEDDLKKDWNNGGRAPVVTHGTCQVIGRSIEVDTFFFEDGVCKKWKVTYEYEDWCTGATGIFAQPISFMYFDTEKPEIQMCNDTMFAVDAACGHDVVLTNVATDGGGCIQGGWLKWQVFIDLWGDGYVDAVETHYLLVGITNGQPRVVDGNWRKYDSFAQGNPQGVLFNPDGVWARVGSATSAEPYIYDADGNVTGDNPKHTKTVSLPSQLRVEGNMSNHKVTWKVTDGCHNEDACAYEFMIVDKKAPTPYCVDLTTALMKTEGVVIGGDTVYGMVELWATDFNAGSFDNCTAQEYLYYTFNEMRPVAEKMHLEHFFNADGETSMTNYLAGLAQRWLPSSQSSARVFTCEDVANSPIQVKMSVWDQKGNTDYCSVTLDVQDHVGACTTGAGRIAGVMNTAAGTAVSGVEATIDNAILPEYPKRNMNSSTGDYIFTNISLAQHYVVTAEKVGGLLDGVNTIDLAKIQRHILELETLDSPYKVIAADINNDERITPSDLLALRKAILGVSSTFPNNGSWRFVDGAQTFDDVLAPFPVDESRETGMFTANMMHEDFVAVKVGDVNGDIDGLLAGNGLQTRSNNSITLVTEDKTVEAGESVSVTFTSNELNEVYGYQFTMDLTGLEFAGVEAGAMAMTTDNVGVLDGKVTVSYNEVNAMTAGRAEGLFTMNFVATEAGRLSDMIVSTSSVTRAEAYVGETMETVGVTIAMREGNTEVAATFALLQNEPNPFKASTTISFMLPTAASAELTILDITGKVVMTKSVSAVAGYNEVTVGKEDIRVSGVLYYQLKSGDFTDTKKMIIIE